MTTISYAIPVCNELEEIQNLVPYLQDNVKPDDEIVVQYDTTNGDPQVLEYLKTVEGIVLVEFPFGGDFSEMKNHLGSKCTKDYIFQVDADEMLPTFLIENLNAIIDNTNPKVDMIMIPRINTVKGIELDDVVKWGWSIGKIEDFKVTEPKPLPVGREQLIQYFGLVIEDTGQEIKYYEPIINPYEYQRRIYINNGTIRWKNKVHEILEGQNNYASLPPDIRYSIHHHKTIDRQRKQNEFYDKL